MNKTTVIKWLFKSKEWLLDFHLYGQSRVTVKRGINNSILVILTVQCLTAVPLLLAFGSRTAAGTSGLTMLSGLPSLETIDGDAGRELSVGAGAMNALCQCLQWSWIIRLDKHLNPQVQQP